MYRISTLLLVSLLLVVPALALDGFSSPRDGFSASNNVVVQNTAVFSTGYVSADGASWESFSLSGQQRGDWVLGGATANIDLQGVRYVAIFSCNWNSGWDCSDNWQVLDREQLQETPSGDYEDSLQGDVQALQDLYTATNGDNWDANDGWQSLTSDSLGEAYGVQVNQQGRVTEIILMDNNLQGELPDSLGNLKQLQKIIVKRNQLSGEIPTGLGYLPEIKYLSLAGRYATDLMTERYTRYNKKWGKATNQYVGGMPDSLYQLTNLEVLEIDGQDGQFGGELKPGVKNWTQLQRIYIHGNLWYEPRSQQEDFDTAWNGHIPKEISAWKDVEVVEAGDNKWSSIAVDAFEGWNNIPRKVSIGFDAFPQSEIHQPFPDVSHLDKIEYLSFGKHRWTGEYPGYLHNFSQLRFLTLSWAEFDDQDLPEFARMPILHRVDFSYMNTKGTLFPPGTDLSGKFNRMILLSLRSSELEGSIPEGMDTFDHLRYIRFHGTAIRGPLPQDPPGLHSPSLRAVYFHGMRNLNGGIPASWGEIGSTEEHGGSFEQGTFTNFGQDENGDYWIEDNTKNWQENELVGKPGQAGPQIRYPDASFAHNRKILRNTNNRIYYQYNLSQYTKPIRPYTNLQIGGEYSIVWTYNTDVRPLDSISFTNGNLDGEIELGAAPKNMAAGGSFSVRNNRLTFADLMPSYEEFMTESQQNGWTYHYSPQKPFGQKRTITLDGEAIIDDFEDEVTHQDNQYQWLRDDNVISGQTSRTLTTSQPGEYVLQVTNPNIPDLTLYSEPIAVVG